jgi:hypothetical protein
MSLSAQQPTLALAAAAFSAVEKGPNDPLPLLLLLFLKTDVLHGAETK